MRLLRIPEPFDHPDFLFEPKIDGFRAVAHIRGHYCERLSRNRHVFKSRPQLSDEIAHAVRCSDAVLDGEICYLRPDGRSDFKSLLFRREWPYFYAFDLLALNGRDLRSLPLPERKRRLFAVRPRSDRASSTSITSTSAASICFGQRADVIWRGSSASGRAARIRSTAAQRRG
jgi:ATP-dependent DNA ligase